MTLALPEPMQKNLFGSVKICLLTEQAHTPHSRSCLVRRIGAKENKERKTFIPI